MCCDAPVNRGEEYKTRAEPYGQKGSQQRTRHAGQNRLANVDTVLNVQADGLRHPNKEG